MLKSKRVVPHLMIPCLYCTFRLVGSLKHAPEHELRILRTKSLPKEMIVITLLLIGLEACNGLLSLNDVSADPRRRLGTGKSNLRSPKFKSESLRHQQCQGSTHLEESSISCRIAGVSVSPNGFHVMLRDKQQQCYLSIPVTRHGDTKKATTPQALTLLQLLASVDMAGAVLPPELLSQLVVVLSERDSGLVQEVQSSIATILASFGTKNQGESSLAYMEQSPWIQSKVRLPTTTLEGITVLANRFLLTCAVEGYGRYSIALDDSDDDTCPWKDLLYEPSNVSAAFVALALALRYNTPISVVSTEFAFIDEDTLRSQFPSYQSADEVLEPADRSADHIARGFEINTLQAALRMAMDRNDVLAATKIREELDRLDSEGMKDLPVQPETDINSMQ